MTRLMRFHLPSLGFLVATLLVISIVAGIAIHAFFMRPSEALLFGGAAGIIVFAIPALSAAVIAAGALSRRSFWPQLKYFLFVALAATVLVAVFYAAAVFAFGLASPTTRALISLANAIVYAAWFVALFVALGSNKRKAIILAAIHPVANLAFLVLWNRWGIVESQIAIPFLVTLPKLGLAVVILLAAFWLIVYLFNAPTKRNLGVSGIQAASLFFAHWLKGSREIEDILEAAGSMVQTTIGTVTFRDSHNRIKALFLAPNIHFGPYGDLGGSEFPAMLTKRFDEAYRATTFVFHGTVFHDFNPVSTTTFNDLSQAFEHCIRDSPTPLPTGELIESNKGWAEVSGLRSGRNAFLTLSPAPYPTGDIDYTVGVALANAAERVFDKAVVADRHNSVGDIEMWGVGSQEYAEFDAAIRAIRLGKQGGRLRIGVAKHALAGYGRAQGVGAAGLRVAVIEAGGKRACYAVFDANNILPQLRDRMLKHLRHGHGFNFVDVCTTDTHSVNGPNTPSNALGERCDWKGLEAALRETVAAAVKDLEPCTATINKANYEARILGSSRANELITTLKSIFAILRILAPAIIGAAILLAIAALLLV